MEQNNQSGNNPHDAAEFGSVRNDSADFRNVPNTSERFGTVPQPSEGFRSIPKPSERKENHTLTVREVARMFEGAGVARTERSITNWCQPNKSGIARLDSYFDPNERKYFISTQSVELAIHEEKAKAEKTTSSEPVGSVPNDSEPHGKASRNGSQPEPEQLVKMEKEMMDLKILNSGKDFLIQQLRQERDGFFDKLLDASRKVGELETKLLQLEEPKGSQATGPRPATSFQSDRPARTSGQSSDS